MMPDVKGADIIVDYLVQEGVDHAFGVCGHGIVGFMDALNRRRSDIRTISVHHEQSAGYMADAYFRIKHKPALTFTSCGPGSANLAIALGAAMYDSSAVFSVTGNVPTSQFNRGPFQETYRHYQADFPSVIRPYVKRSFQPTRVDMLPTAVRQAYKTMTTGRTGPVNLDVPLNVFQESADVEVPVSERWTRGISRRPAGEPAAVQRAWELLLSASRPLIMTGNGVMLSEASPELGELAHRLGIPVITTPLAMGTFDMDDPLSLGTVGRNGTYAANEASKAADVILAVGTRFCDRVSSSWIPGYSFNIPPTKLIHVDIDPDEIGRNYPVAVGIVGDAKAVLSQMLQLLDGGGQVDTSRTEPWRRQVAGWVQVWEDFYREYYESAETPIRPERVVAELRRVMPDDGILLADVGVHHNWLVQHARSRWPGGMLQSWGYAAMGFAVSGVLGAKLAAPERPAVAVCGDGGFMMTSHAVATAVEYNIPAVWIVWNNYGYVSIRDLQVAAFESGEWATSFMSEESGTLFSPDYAAMSRAMGGEGITVTKPGALAEAFEYAIGLNKPVVVDVAVNRDVIPYSTGTWVLPPFKHPEPSFPRALRQRQNLAPTRSNP